MRTLLLFLLSLSCFSQTLRYEKSMPLREIAAELFDGKVDAATGEITWKPNTGERFRFQMQEDTVLYTVIDTTFSRNTGSTAQLIIATETYRKSDNGSRIDCHLCAPALGLIVMEEVPESRHYAVHDFYKYVTHYGTWGEPAQLSLLELEGRIPIIVIDWNWFGQGISDRGKTFIYEGKPLLDVAIASDNESGTDDPAQMYAYDTEMEVDGLVLAFTRKGTEPDSNGKVVKANKVVRYKFDPGAGTFEKI